eukprot:jgi/Mesvir1/24142/Mv10859-RA.1
MGDRDHLTESRSEPRVDTNVLVDSKREYVEQLERSLSQPVFAAFKNILQDAVNVSGAKGTDCMECLTKLLAEVPSWNADIIDEETKEIQKTVPYLRELLKAYFVCASMILGSIRRNSRNDQKLKVKVPTCERFVHSVMKTMAADIAEDIPHYVSQTSTGGVKLNKRQVMKGVCECVKNALQSFMPIDDILKDYMDGIMGADDPPPSPPARRRSDEQDEGGHRDRTRSVRLRPESLQASGRAGLAGDEDEEDGFHVDEDDPEAYVEEEEDF